MAADNGQSIADGTQRQFHFVPTDQGLYTVTLQVTDNQGDIDTDTVLVRVENAAPQVSAGVDQTVAEGQVVTLAGLATDAGRLDALGLKWNVASDNGQVIAAGSGQTFSFVPTDEGTYTVTLAATDDDAAVGRDTVVITVTGTAPIANAGPDQIVNEGDQVTADGSLTDAGAADTHTFDWQVTDAGGQLVAEGTSEDSHGCRRLRAAR